MAGQRIDDHSFWAGGRSKASVFPEGVKTKNMSEGPEYGAMGRYEDTAEAIHRQQSDNVRKAKGHNMKEGYRY